MPDAYRNLTQSLAAKAARPLSFLSGNYPNQEIWRGYTRKKIFELLHYAPPRVQFEPTVLEETEVGGCIRRRVEFSSSPFTKITAYLLLPRASHGKMPGVLCLHDHGDMFAWGKEKLVQSDADSHPALAQYKREKFSGISVAPELARAGFAVLAIDGFYFGDRRLAHLPELDALDMTSVEGHSKFEAIAARHEPLAALELLQAGITPMGLHVWDAIRAVEYLASVDGIDERRIGCFGAFSGGLQALFVSGLCDIVRSTCAVGWVTSFGSLIQRGVPGTSWHQYVVPGLYNFLDLPDIAGLSVPRALYLIGSENDPHFPVGDSFKKIRKVYEMAECGDDFASQTCSGNLVFNAEMMAASIRWFQRWL